jgi:DNA-directed RNA polymerase specialized sigma24 family protein
VLQALMGLSTQEIAAQLGLTQGAVLTRLFRARHKLRRELGIGAADEVSGDEASPGDTP